MDGKAVMRRLLELRWHKPLGISIELTIHVNWK